MYECAPCCLVKSVVQSYQCCVINLTPSRSVHYIYGQSCPVQSQAGVSCNAVHHGFCLPVNVSLIECHQSVDVPIAQLSLDTSGFLSNSPSYCSPNSSVGKPSSLSKRSSWGDKSDRGSSELGLSWSEKSDTSSTCEEKGDINHIVPSGSSSVELDTTAELAKLQASSLSHDLATQVEVAKIAQQITDHAEAIYQTWKQKGLSPEQILNVHTIGFDAKLKNDTGVGGQPRAQNHHDRPRSVELNPVNLLASPDFDGKLHELVNNFISEDKARRSNFGGSPKSPLSPPSPKSPKGYSFPSAVQLGRQRFEKSENGGSSWQSKTLPRSMPSGVTKPVAPPPVTPINPPTNATVSGSSGTWPRINKQAANHVPLVAGPSMGAKPFLEEPSPHIPQPQPKASQSSSISTPQRPVLDRKPTEDVTSGLVTWPKNIVPNHSDVTVDKSAKRSKKFDTLPNDPQTKDWKQLEDDLILALKSGNSSTNLTKDCGRVSVNGTVQESKHNTIRDDRLINSRDNHIESQDFQSRVKPAINYNNEVFNQNDDKIGSSSTESSGSRSPKYQEEEVSGLSTVDYAKQRYRAASKNPMTQQRLDNQRQMKQQEHVHTVSETRSRFETGLVGSGTSPYRAEWVPTLHTEEGGKRAVVRPKVRNSSSPEPQSLSPLPHPELTQMQKQHIRERSEMNIGGVPIRPFLTRGSVAERVLIFEKCPTELRESKASTVNPNAGPAAYNAWKGSNDVHTKSKNYVRERESGSPPRSPTSTLRRQARRQSTIPRFHFPQGRPGSPQHVEASMQKVAKAFESLPGRQAHKQQFGQIAKACELPMYLKAPLYLAAGGDGQNAVLADTFLDFWRRVINCHYDAAGRLIRILTRGNRVHLLPEDWVPMVQDIVDTHPGLSFLREAQEFHSRYVHTVIARIYYTVNRSWSGQVTVNELRRSNLLHVLKSLELTDDINRETNYFSYEHFYVIYCKFWELDTDHDLLIDKADLSRHNDHAISSRMIDRIFSGAVTRGRNQREEKMSYTEFIWFLMSEEDKRHPTAIEYWFRCMDIDGDGYLSMYELEYFYEEQLQRLEALGIETLPFKDCLCQMLDMIRPETLNLISLRDLKHCRMSPVFFDTFFNLEKYLDHEHKDPFATQRDPDDAHMCDWERYAAEEYELLVAEEGANEQHEELMYDDDVEVDELSPNLDNIMTEAQENDEYHY